MSEFAKYFMEIIAGLSIGGLIVAVIYWRREPKISEVDNA